VLDYYEEKQHFITLSNIDEENDIVNACVNLNLESTAKCLNKNFKQFYFYNESNIGADLTFDELKQQGGVCSHAVAMYINLATRLGYQIEEVIVLPTDLNIGHTFIVMYDDTGYCVLDQTTTPHCVKIDFYFNGVKPIE